MKKNRVSSAHLLCWKVVVVLVACASICGMTAWAQTTTGPNAVWSANGATFSYEFIDASVAGGSDICAMIFNTLTASNYPSTGAVIDARGIHNTITPPTTPLTCQSGTPWVQGLNNTSKPSTILLPVGTIVIPTTWVLPDHTRLFGEQEVGGTIGYPVTTLQPSSGFTPADSSSSIIEMGSSSQCPNGCTGISIEHVSIDSAGQALNMIYNGYAGDQSYVNDVNLVNMYLNGLVVAAAGSPPNSLNSGPYSNLNINTFGTKTPNCSPSNTASCPACVRLQVQTRGLHGLTCTGQNYTGYTSDSGPNIAAIYANASNLSIQDVHIESYTNGIEVAGAANFTVGNVVISNVDGATKGACGGAMINLIHLCGGNSNGRPECPLVPASLTDVAINSVTLVNGQTSNPVTAVIQDDLTGSAIVSGSTPLTVGSYAVGETIEGLGTQYSKITTSSQAPSWASGQGQPPIPPPPQCTTGTIYSNTTTTGKTIYLCKGGGVWVPIA